VTRSCRLIASVGLTITLLNFCIACSHHIPIAACVDLQVPTPVVDLALLHPEAKSGDVSGKQSTASGRGQLAFKGKGRTASSGKERVATKHAAAGASDGAEKAKATQESLAPTAGNVVGVASGGPHPARSSKVRQLKSAVLVVWMICMKFFQARIHF